MSASTREYVNNLLEQVDEEQPPLDVVDEDDWAGVSENMARFLVDEKDDSLLNSVEQHGARLMLSPDQKRIRPGIFVELAEALDTDIPEDELVQLASSIEGIHFYTKGMDDIQDGDRERNGYLTLHAFLEEELGDEKLAVSMADNYFTDIKNRNDRMITGLDEEYFSAEEREALRDAMRDVEGELVEGQNLDLSGNAIGDEELGLKPNYLGGDLDVMKRNLEGNYGKTAALFGLIGSYVDIATDYDGEDIEEWGRKAGQAFQIHDDVLDLENERFSDLKEGHTVPIYVAERYLHTHPGDEERSKEEYRERGEQLTEIIQMEDPGDAELQQAYDIIMETPAVDAAENMAEYLTREANKSLDEVDWDAEEDVDKIKYMTEVMGYMREK